MTSYGGRKNSFSNRGRGNRGGRSHPPVHFGNRQLVSSDISGLSLLKQLENNPDTWKKVQELIKTYEEESSSSYANTAVEQDDNESYERKYSDQNILILENRDLQWKDEPWNLIQRYLGSASYAAGMYKQRNTYESMLKATDSCEIRHFMPNSQAKIYNFSKIIIKQIISVEEWGLNPFSEKEFNLPNQNISAKFNFWDYKDAFYKTFLYQNSQRKHTWFIKVCPQVYKRKIPNWLYDWWLIYGGNENILPQQYLELFHKWEKVSPAIIEAEYDKTFSHNMAVLHFFCEFGIPWIWRWEPEVRFNQENIPCLKRVFYIKFWKKMIRKNADGIIEGQETVSQIESKIAEYEEKISNKQQRKAFNPFDLIEERAAAQHLSKKERYNKLMKEAEEAILQKLGPDTDLPNKQFDESSSFQESQGTDNFMDDKEMAEFYSKMCPRSYGKKTSSESDSMEIEAHNASDDDTTEELKGSKKKKKGKGKKR